MPLTHSGHAPARSGHLIAQTDCNPLALHLMVSTVCQRLRRLDPRDVELSAVIACWEDASVDQGRDSERNGVTVAIFECAPKRLRNTIRQLSMELHEAMQDLLRTAA